jgi:hypothetical protein
VTGENHLIGDGGKAIAALARKIKIPFHAVPAPGRPTARAPPHINNVNAYHGRLKQGLNRFNGAATKNLPNYLGWRLALTRLGCAANRAAFSTVTIGDQNASATNTLTITLSSQGTTGRLSGKGLTDHSGVYTLTGAAADIVPDRLHPYRLRRGCN